MARRAVGPDQPASQPYREFWSPALAAALILTRSQPKCQSEPSAIIALTALATVRRVRRRVTPTSATAGGPEAGA